MKTISIASLLALLAVGVAGAEVPKKVSDSTYSHLWNSSPFTNKPPPVVPTEAPSAFEDWALSGVSQVNGGYLVTLQHRKNQGESQVIKPDRVIKYLADGTAEETMAGKAGAFKVDSVEYSKKGWKETVVHLSAGGRSGTVKFDDKLLSPKVAAAPQQQRGQQGMNPNGQNNGQNGQPPMNNNGQVQPQPAQPTNQQPAAAGTPQVRPPRPRR